MAERQFFWHIVVILSVLRFARGQTDSCPTFGTDQSSRLSKSSEERIFMNFEAPSQCTGNVTSWRFCYYRNVDDDFDEISDSRDFEAIFLIYRRESIASDNYMTVAGSVREKALQWSVVQSSRFTCMDEVLSSEEYFEIQQNDIVGACIKDVRGASPLLLVGTSSGSTFQTYQLDRSDYQDCTSVQTNIVDTSDSKFKPRRTSTLHLFANIADADTCRVGNNPSPADAVTSSLGGTYLNVGTPVTCNNHITKWHYCYHTEAATPGGSTLSMIVAVWSLDTATNTYIVSPTSIRTITLQPIQTLAKIFCVEELLSENDFVLVSTGDVIGVVLPSNGAIPIVSSNANPPLSIMKRSQNGNPIDLLQSDLIDLSSSALHLYATIIYRDLPTTKPLTTTTAIEPATTFTTVIISEPTTEMLTSQATTQAVSEVTTEATMEIVSTNMTETDVASETVTGATDEATSQASSEPTTEAITESATEAEAESSTAAEAESATEAVITTSQSISTVNVAERDNQRSRSLAVGDITAIILSIVLTFGAVMMTVFLIVYIKRRKKGKYSTKTTGFDNILYSIPERPDVDDHVTLYDSIAEPYVYSETMIARNIQKPLESSIVDYQFIDDYYTPLDSAHAYKQELEHVRRGSAVNKPESIYTDPGNNEEEIYSFLKTRRINNIQGCNITIRGLLGSGQFGTVHRGDWMQAPKHILDVALKSLKEGVSSSDKVKFLQEAATMAQFRHPNVAALYGVTDKDRQMMIVVELLSKGDLRQYLKGLLPDPGELVQASAPNLLLQFSQQICLGMSYLASTGFVHRDLAARNVLISDSFICKIADFGMSRDLHEEDYYTSSGGKIPLKWTAPESIHYKKFSTASDVWSYGCVLYEIWSLGHKPYDELGNVEVLRLIDTGGRLAPPPGCPKMIYQLMIQCWAPKPKQRPGFRNVLLSMLENESVILHIPPDVTDSHQQAATLGSPLKAGYLMYTDIQKTYMSV